MIEAGLAIIAACLPTLQFLARKASINSIFDSLRSAFSLRSIHSQEPQRLPSRSNDVYLDTRAVSETESAAPIMQGGGRSEVTVKSDMSRSGVEEHGIHVTREISQHDDITV